MSISTLIKATGIIYRAYNKISNKSYIGQSKNDIKTRKQQHYSKAREKNCTYKFVNALRLYPEDSWVWEVLLEVEIDKLNDYEKFFIQDLDTLNNGYNSTLDKYKAGKKYTTTIYELYQDEYGVVSGTIDDFRLIDIGLAAKLLSLKNGTQKSCKGWRLLKNKDYKPPIDIVTLIHYEHGIHTLTRKEFTNNFGLHYKEISSLTRRKTKCCKGWILRENKDQCNEIWNMITLTHDTEGTFTLPATEFIRRFGLDTTSISQLKKKKREIYKNWKLVEENNEYSIRVNY